MLTRSLLFFSLVLCSASILLAGEFVPPPPAVPIDGGVSLLAAAGVAYGVKKYRDSKKAS